MSLQSIKAQMMAILDATVAHLVGRYPESDIIRYKMIALYWYDQEGRPSAAGFSWQVLPDGRRHCIVRGQPCTAYGTGTPLTLEELRVYDPLQ